MHLKAFGSESHTLPVKFRPIPFGEEEAQIHASIGDCQSCDDHLVEAMETIETVLPARTQMDSQAYSPRCHWGSVRKE